MVIWQLLHRAITARFADRTQFKCALPLSVWCRGDVLLALAAPDRLR